MELRDRFFTPRRSMIEDTDCGQLDEMDVIPNEEILLVLSQPLSFLLVIYHDELLYPIYI